MAKKKKTVYDISTLRDRFDNIGPLTVGEMEELFAHIASLQAEVDALIMAVCDLRQESSAYQRGQAEAFAPCGLCQHEDCGGRPATCWAQGQREGHCDVRAYCDAHSLDVACEGYPEHRTFCPNCGCAFGVN